MMLKYMKYEIKGSYKYILGILALVMILITGLYSYVSNVKEGSAAGNIFIALSIMILFGTALATFLFIVGSFRKELYEDRGYLTFTLPLTGNQIVGSKLIVALLWFFILAIVIALYNVLMAFSFSPFELNLLDLFTEITQNVSVLEIAYMLVTTVFSGVNMLILIYFSMALSKVTFRHKRIGALWFVIFLILSGILGYGQMMISELLPYYLDLETFSIEAMTDDSYNMNIENNGFSFGVNPSITTNLAGSLYIIILTVALFLGTGHLIEKKIDL